jgi:glycosyltransferase involved in cell wall biosynthesis
METCDIFVFHSLEESQGIAICEAMAAGKPVVATNVGGIPCVVKEDVNGKLSAFGDVESFAENIKTLLVDNELRNAMGTTNQKQAQKYAWDKIADEVLKIYNE